MSERRRPVDTEQPVAPGAIDRRTALVRMSTIVAAAALPALAGAPPQGGPDPRPATGGKRLRKIATEEAFIIPEVAEAVRNVVRQGGPNLDLKLLRLIYDAPPETPPSGQSLVPGGPVPVNRDAFARTVLPRLLDFDSGRLADMDANGVDMHLLSITMPGVQMFEADTAIALDRLLIDGLHGHSSQRSAPESFEDRSSTRARGRRRRRAQERAIQRSETRTLRGRRQWL